jgi:hypothetical protein
MSPQAEAASSKASLLTIRAGQRVWGIPSAAVIAVERPSADTAAAALDVHALLGMPAPGDDGSRRVLLVRAGGERARILVQGTLALLETSSANLLPVPASLSQLSPLVSHVAVIDGKPALFVVSPERLLRASRERDADSISNADDAARGL